MKNKKPTLTEIANALGISTVSVSRALSGQSGISDDLRNKVIDKANELGYLKKKSDSLKILVLHLKPYTQDNSNFSLLMQRLERSLQHADTDYSIEFIPKETQDQLLLPYKLSKCGHFDGVIFIGKFDLKYMALVQKKIPCQVLFTGYSPGYMGDSIWFNFNNSGYQQCEYLIQKGHKNIGFLGNISLIRNKEKLLGITTALENYNLLPNEDLFIENIAFSKKDQLALFTNRDHSISYIDKTDINYSKKLVELIQSKKDLSAIICEWDFTAIELINLLQEHNIKVPEDISIMGSGNSEYATVTTPTLTTMDINVAYASDLVVKTLIKRIKLPFKHYKNIGVLCTLVERNSVTNKKQL
ncbi:LacI family transcriptional regulator [Natranaerovirga pectinivora]|uniref:LacI family transcriptional regulator n=1 Tax=Natranaerovirga pectinivora TaxID=682400 RepID=A0A4R3MT08_9FIRM|nr:LacI family DNA-binding transcriptional regulator [Natranaerovirga pectinivora]TCT16174.1 LacI family transcriptional regulator [Natranaerovirga pectinivora]